MDEMCAACEVLDESDDCPCLCHIPDRTIIGGRINMSDLVTIHFPEVEQRRYCATCHEPAGVHVYPAITVEVPPEADARQPSSWAFVHISTCPIHPT